MRSQRLGTAPTQTETETEIATMDAPRVQSVFATQAQAQAGVSTPVATRRRRRTQMASPDDILNEFISPSGQRTRFQDFANRERSGANVAPITGDVDIVFAETTPAIARSAMRREAQDAETALQSRMQEARIRTRLLYEDNDGDDDAAGGAAVPAMDPRTEADVLPSPRVSREEHEFQEAVRELMLLAQGAEQDASHVSPATLQMPSSVPTSRARIARRRNRNARVLDNLSMQLYDRQQALEMQQRIAEEALARIDVLRIEIEGLRQQISRYST